MDQALAIDELLTIIFGNIDAGSDWKSVAFTCTQWSVIIHKTRADGPVALANHLKTLIKMYPNGIGDTSWNWASIAQNPNIDIEYLKIMSRHNASYFANNPNATPEFILNYLAQSDGSNYASLTNAPSVQFVKDNPNLPWNKTWLLRNRMFSLKDVDDIIGKSQYPDTREVMTTNVNFWHDRAQYPHEPFDNYPGHIIANPSTSFDTCTALMLPVGKYDITIMENPNITLEFAQKSKYQYHARNNPAFTLDECAGLKIYNGLDYISLHPALTWKYVYTHPEIKWDCDWLAKNLFTKWQPGDYHTPAFW